MDEKQEIVPQSMAVTDNSEFSMYLDSAKFSHGQRVANMLASATRVPDCYRSKPADCFLAFQMATRLNMDPVVFMQQSYVVHGKAGMEAKLIIALVNTRGPFKGPIRWKTSGEGESFSCTAFATHEEDGELCEATVTYKMAKAEGWLDKPGSKWKTLPDLMYRYRSAVFLSRLFCPEVIMGFKSIEELHDIGPQGGIPLPAAEVSPLESRLKSVENTAIETEQEKTAGGDPIGHAEPTAEETTEPTKKKRKPNKKTPAGAPSDNPKPEPCDATTVPVEASSVPAEVPDQVKNNVAPEERWMCNACSEVFAEATGTGKNLCRECLSKDIVDRWA